MVRRHPREFWLLLLLALSPAACQQLRSAEEPQPAKPAPTSADGLTPEARKAARELAEQSDLFTKGLTEKERGFLKGERSRDPKGDKDIVYFTQAEVVPTKDDGERPRGLLEAALVVVSHYRYGTDEVVRSTVDLKTKKVLHVERFAHLPTPLADEEFADAKKLALADEKLKAALKPYGDKLKIQPLLPRVGDKDPAYGHRLVNLVFHVGTTYLTSPRVIVDLTTRTVKVETIMPPMLDH
jgi:hypothetical protein